MAKPNGYVLWQGPSELDGSPIVVIATGFAKDSDNSKTGAMIQTHIMRSDMEPHTALTTGDDAAVCGGCVHRPKTGGACYVLVHNAQLAVYRAWERGNYPSCDDCEHPAVRYSRGNHVWNLAHRGEGRAVRLGSYGDPGAVPTWVWEAFVSKARTWTGYTHQWRTCDPALQPLCMASVDSDWERIVAQQQGWRTFRVTTHEGWSPAHDEILCPASEEAGRKTTCDKCGLCQGTTAKTSKSIVIPAHGAKKRKAKVS
jgi:hypothetical protein